MKTNTPETDAALQGVYYRGDHGSAIPALCRNLERERNEARDLAELYRNRANESHLPLHRMPWENSSENAK